MRKIQVAISSINRSVVLLESADRRTSDLCLSGLFNMCGGINARKISVSNTDTHFLYNIVSDDIKKNQIEIAKAFCKGIKYAMRS